VTTLFISDLHLCSNRPDITAQFIDFLRDEARGADHLYILGDLFEFWIGDDDPDSAYADVQQALHELTASGVPCSIMHGNRDFLLGRQFCTRTGCNLIDDATVIDLHGQRVLLMHGDVLCTDDHGYQRLRRIVRNPVIQWLFKRLSLARRERIATRIRQGSQQHTRAASAYIMDVNEEAVRAVLRKHQVATMIHGHTHRPKIHTHSLDEQHTGTRIVLGDWHESGSVLRWSASSYALTTLPRTTR